MRRSIFRSSTIAGPLAASASSSTPAASPPGEMVGKVTVGYQGWFACSGDGAPINGWWHWSRDMVQPPSRSNTTIATWPDAREYTATYQTAYSNLGNGQPANLFSSYDQQTVNTCFQWMQQNGCDTAALQRFNPTGGEGPTRDAHGIDYQPCVIPGDLQSGHRSHGDLMWRQFYNLCRVGVRGIYISMFDEYNEGNQIAKTAETSAWVPTDQTFALNKDGTACSSDYYLRLTADGGKCSRVRAPSPRPARASRSSTKVAAA